MKKRYTTIALLFFTLASCNNFVDVSNITMGDHGLSYMKGTNTLVTGKVVRKIDNAKIVELHNCRNGEMIGDWFQYDDKGNVVSRGFGTEIKKYENSLNGTDLTYSILSIVRMNHLRYATLYMDNHKLFDEPEKLVQLSKDIFEDYADRYKIDDLLIFDNEHAYTVTKTATTSTNYIVDTIADAKIKKMHFH